MSKYRRILKWSVVGFGSLLLIVVIGAALYTRTQDFDERVRQQSVDAINRAIRGTISVERVEGSIWRKLTLHNVTLRFEGDEVLQVPRLSVSYSLLSLVFGPLKIGRIDVERPRANLKQDDEGRWNIVEAVALREPPAAEDSEFAVFVRSLRVADGDFSLRLAGAEDKVYRVTHFRLDGRIDLPPAGPHVEVREVAASLLAQGQPDLNVKGALEYQAAAEPAVLKIKDFWAVTANSRVRLNGETTHGEAIHIKAQAALEKLAPSDMAAFFPEWPIKHVLAGTLAVDGTLSDLSGDVKLAAAGARMAGKFTADVTADQPRYAADVAFNGFDLPRWLDHKAVAGVASGSIQASGTGFELARTTAKGQLEVRGAAVQDWALGAVSMAGRLQDGVAALDGRVKSQMGGADWSGKIALKEKRPSYEIALSVKNLDVQKTVPDGQALQGKINFQGTVKGAGFSLADLNTSVDMQILPSSLGPVEIKQGTLNATLSDKKLRIARATLSTADSALTVNGEFSLGAEAKGNLDYQLRVGDLSPWLSLANRKGSGAVDLSGKVQGNLADMQTQGSARLAALRLDGIAVKDGNVAFALQRAQDRAFPSGTLTARLADVEAGIALRSLDATAKLSREPAESIQLDMNALDLSERRHALSGMVDFASDATTLRVSRLSVAAPDGAWNLVRPATVTQRGEVFFIEQLSMRSGDRVASLDGRFAFAGAQDLTLEVQRFPLAAISSFLPQQPKITGLLAVQARITGTAAAPEIAASARLSDSTIAGQAYAGAVAAIDYKDGKARLKLAVQQDATHFLNGSGTLPLVLNWHDGWRADLADGMELRVQSAGLSLGFLNAFGGKNIENIAGELTLDVLARGSIKQPDLRGTFNLHDGRIKAVALGVDIQQVAASGSLDSRTITLRELTARAKDGTISGSGTLALKDLHNGAIKLALTARRWPAVETLRHQVKIDGDLDVQGSLSALRIKGQITVSEGSLRPDLVFLEQSKVPLKRDETIVIVRNNDGGRAPIPQKPVPAGVPDNDVLKNAALDLMVRAPGNLWIRHPDIVSELSGNIHATKAPGRDIDLKGRIDVVRGWVSFQGRRFQLARGRIEFIGGTKIDPTLDIVAQYRLPQYLVEAIIGGTAEKPSLTLASQPRLEQADILSLLVFGKPIDALNQKEKGSLQESAINITGGYLAGRIANSVSEALGLDRLGVDIRQVSFAGGGIGFGSYVGDRTYLSVSQQLSGEHGREVSVEYQLAPEWKLGTSTTSTGSSGIDLIWQKRY
jgi:autotransporter translocation and assembly factor TamB